MNRSFLRDDKNAEEQEMDAIGTVGRTYVRTYYPRMTHVRNIRSSIPRGLLHSSTFAPHRIPRRPTVQLKIPICRPSSTLPPYSRASLRHSGVFWNSRDSRTCTRIPCDPIRHRSNERKRLSSGNRLRINQVKEAY